VLANKDKLSRAAKGRYFPYSASQLLRTIKAFRHSDSYQRLDLLLINPESEDEFGPPIAAFYPGEAVLVYSHPTDFAPERAVSLLEAALREFKALDEKTVISWNPREKTSYRAYLAANNNILLTHRVRSRTLVKYRGGAKFSNAFKPKKVSTDEKPLRQLAVT
jgi:hypothetical protein